ncbi:MAG: alpha/beta hydrolase, partial [Thermodesulfobacteriota bacterium]|nr:alpha/beta hydrolase [Thermodesulfobacteriota bacterium]
MKNIFYRRFLQGLYWLWFTMIFSMITTIPVFAEYKYYFPYFSNSKTKGEMLGLALTNLEDKAARIKITLLDQNGTPRMVETLEVPALSQQADVIGRDLDEVEGSFMLLSDRRLSGVAFLFSNQSQVMCWLPMTQNTATNLDIPYVVENNEWGTKILICNPYAEANSVTLSYRNANGFSSDAKYSAKLKAYGSIVMELSDLKTFWKLDKLDGGSFKLTSNDPGIVAFAVCDDFKSDGNLYSGFSAVPDVSVIEETFKSQTDIELQTASNRWNIVASLDSYQAWHTQALQSLETKCVVTNLPGFGQVSYVWIGEGPVILVSHGGVMGYDNAFMLTDLMAEGFSLLCPSRPGYPGTPLFSGINDSFELAADMMAALVDSLNIDKVFILGTSAGGPTALQFALRHKDKLHGVLLLDAVSQSYVADTVSDDNFVAPLLVPADFQDPKSFKLLDATRRHPEEILRNWFELVVVADDSERVRLAAKIASDPDNVRRLLQFTETITPVSRRYIGTINDSMIMANLPDYSLQNIVSPVFVSHSLYDG